MVLARILISLPLSGLRPARALRVRGRKVPKPTTVTRLPFATLVTIASNTAFTASLAATLLTFPAFAATWTRSDLVTTCGMRIPPDFLACDASKHPIQTEIETQRTSRDFAHGVSQPFMIGLLGGGQHMFRALLFSIAAALAVPAAAQTTLTYSSWVSPQHHLSIWQANWT